MTPVLHRDVKDIRGNAGLLFRLFKSILFLILLLNSVGSLITRQKASVLRKVVSVVLVVPVVSSSGAGRTANKSVFLHFACSLQ